jgi:erythronate-4-phosphate dehydrogenase
MGADEAKLLRLMHLVYDVRRDDAAAAVSPGNRVNLIKLRKHYQERREWSSLRVQCDDSDQCGAAAKAGL